MIPLRLLFSSFRSVSNLSQLEITVPFNSTHAGTLIYAHMHEIYNFHPQRCFSHPSMSSSPRRRWALDGLGGCCSGELLTTLHKPPLIEAQYLPVTARGVTGNVTPVRCSKTKTSAKISAAVMFRSLGEHAMQHQQIVDKQHQLSHSSSGCLPARRYALSEN